MDYLGQTSNAQDGVHLMVQNYPIDVSDFYEFANQGYCEFDLKQVPLIDYDRVFGLWGILSGRRFGKQYNPVAIAQYGLAAIARLNQTACAEDEGRLRGQIYACAEWLCANHAESADGIYWPYGFDFPPYRLSCGFTSCMAQGFAISLLLRAHQIFGETRFFEIGIWARDFFKNEAVGDDPVNFVRNFSDIVWFEEYPSRPPSQVLNGYLFAIISLHDSLAYLEDPVVSAIVQDAVRQLPFVIKMYDLGHWSRYDLQPGRTATLTYHHVHLLQLQYFCEQFENDGLAPFLEKWSSGSTSQYYRFVYHLKSKNPRIKLSSLIYALTLRYKKYLRVPIWGS